MKVNDLKLIAIAAISAGSISINTDKINAATITYDITVNNLDGSLSGNEFTGDFSFDDATLTGVGSELIPIDNLDFEFQGAVFTENDDITASAAVEFFDGDFLGLSYSVDADFSFIPGFFSLSESFFAYDLGGGNIGTGDIIYTLDTSNPEPNPIAEPATIIGLLTTAILGNSLRKNKLLR